MIKISVLLTCTLLVAAVIAGAVTLQAKGAATAAITCGMVVTTSITASNDLACTGDGLVVGAANITLNLGGHTIDGDDDAGDYGISNNGFDNVKIKNGQITDFFEGVKLVGDADKNEITNLEIRSSSGDGIDFSTTSDQATVKNNRILQNVTGIDLSATGHTITGNRFVANTGDGMDVRTNGSLVANNVVTLNGNQGMEVTGGNNTIQKNLVSRNASFGIALMTADATSNLVKLNQVFGNGSIGLFVDSMSTSNTLDSNVLVGNANDGLDVNGAGGTNTIKKNTADGNGDRGIEATSGIDGGGNKAAGNVNAQQCQVVVCS
jgi:parallel beta-helix repeat protein